MKYDGKISYTEFFAFNKTVGKNIDNLEDSDCCSRMLREYCSGNYTRKKQKIKPVDGWFRRYWSNGNLRYEWFFKNGKQEGASISWWPNGDRKSEMYYENGKLHGVLRGWYENGSPRVKHENQLSGIQYYNHGKKTGKWIDYYKSGQKWSEREWNNNKLISQKYWERNGKESNRKCYIKAEKQQFKKINPKWK